MESQIHYFDIETNQKNNSSEYSEYLDGSHNLNWDGIIVEKVKLSGYEIKNMKLKDNLFLLSLDDDIYLKVNGKNFHIMPDELWIMASGYSFNLKNKKEYNALFLSVTTTFLEKFFYDKNLAQVNFTNPYEVEDETLKELIRMIYRQSILKADFRDPFLNKLFESFVIYYVSNYSDYKKGTIRNINSIDMLKVDEYIYHNIDRNIETVEFAKLLNMQHYLFLSEFRKYNSEAPYKYIMNIKFELAKKQLIASGKSISCIAKSLGFHDGSHFSKFFKNKCGVSPIKYRKSHQVVNFDNTI